MEPATNVESGTTTGGGSFVERDRSEIGALARWKAETVTARERVNRVRAEVVDKRRNVADHADGGEKPRESGQALKTIHTKW